jgi:AcrR family transcriptional regulator
MPAAPRRRPARPGPAAGAEPDRPEQRAPTPVWAREPAQRRPGLTQEAIVAAAIAIADAEGLAAVSIRRVAAGLGARAMSLYTYIERKEDLLYLMADRVAGEVLIPPGELPADWRAAITMVVRRERAVASRHPWMIELVGRQVRFGPNGLRHAEQTLAALAGLGLGPQATVRVAAAIDTYSLGQVVRQEGERGGSRRDGLTDAERETLMQPYFQRLLASGEFPRLAPVLAGGGLRDGGDTFEQGLSWLLDGIEAEYAGGKPRLGRRPAG